MNRQLCFVKNMRPWINSKNWHWQYWISPQQYHSFSTARLSTGARCSSSLPYIHGYQLYKEGLAVRRILQRSDHLPVSVARQFSSSPCHLQKSASERNNKNGDEEDKDLKALLAKAALWMLTAYMFIAIMSLLFPGSNQPEVVRYVSWNEFVHQMLAKGEVEEVIVRPDLDIVTIILQDGAIVKSKRVEHKTFHMNIIDIHRFEEKLREAETRLGVRPENGVPLIYERNSDTAGKLLASVVIVALLLSMLSRNRSIRSPLSMDSFNQLARAKFTIVDPLVGGGRGVRFKDVAGLKEAKIEIMEFVDYLKRPEYYKKLGAKVPKGALLLGPPGCGKTMLAKAVATEGKVPFLSMNGSEFIEMIGGLGAARVRDLYKEARKRAPCIIYIDEIDAIGRQRSSVGSSMEGTSGEGEQTLNQLLVEMDGMASKEGVVILASTNRPDVLDMALLRPGRFDRHILIDLPTQEERRNIFEHHLQSVVLEKPASAYSRRLASLSPGFSGADIANVCNEAALHAARYKNKSVTGNDLEYAIERVVGGTEKRTQVLSMEERKVVAYHESGHALVGWLLEYTDALLKVSIVPRTNHALGFAQTAPNHYQLHSEDELFEKMCMALGGRVAESLVFNQVTTGAQTDLEKVTRMAYAQTRSYGMNRRIGPISFPEEETREVGRRPFSISLQNLIDFESKQLAAAAYKRTERLLSANRDKLDLLAQSLLEKETLNYDDVEALIGSSPFGKKKLIGQEAFEASVDRNAGVTPEPKEKKVWSEKDDGTN